jgi:hypothetical protein
MTSGVATPENLAFLDTAWLSRCASAQPTTKDFQRHQHTLSVASPVIETKYTSPNIGKHATC